MINKLSKICVAVVLFATLLWIPVSAHAAPATQGEISVTEADAGLAGWWISLENLWESVKSGLGVGTAGDPPTDVQPGSTDNLNTTDSDDPLDVETQRTPIITIEG